MKFNIFLIIALFFLTSLFAQNIVINEVFYNPEGSDGNKEWIEFYNPTENSISLELWLIQAAGTSFSTVFSFPIGASISSQSFILVGESDVANCDFYSNLNFQNGDNQTDGIRIISSNGDYTDTVLYDSPNSNNLPADIEQVTEFCPNVAAGNSLARLLNGIDTNQAIDFSETSILTPGAENLFPTDLAVNYLNVDNFSGKYTLNTHIVNLSTQIVHNLTAQVDIFLNSNLTETVFLAEINPQDSLYFEIEIPVLNLNLVNFTLEISHPTDFNLDNNFASQSIVNGENPLVINEIMFYPDHTKPEWIELFNRSDNEIDLQTLSIFDAAGNQTNFSGIIYPKDFFVVSQFSSNLQDIYPDIDLDKIIVANDWATLNNDGDEVKLYYFSTLLDSILYDDEYSNQGFSLERVNPFVDEDIEYYPSISSFGATPTFENSILPNDYDLIITSTKIEEITSAFIHNIEIQNSGIYNLENAFLRIFLAENTNEFNQLYQENFDISTQNQFHISTEKLEDNHLTFKYQIQNESDLNESNNSSYQFVNNSTFPICTNEIMFNPNDEEPEWIEIRRNMAIDEFQFATIVVDTDTLQIPIQSKYTIITCSQEDSLTLSDFTISPIYYGLNSLNNSGETIKIYDPSGNVIENFIYQTDICTSKGISIERILPNLAPNSENWGQSKVDNSLGKENSLFTEYIPSSASLKISPKTFSPYRAESAVIQFTLPKILNKITIRIFDLKGRLVRKIINQEINSSSGDVIWDGKNDNNQNLNSGIYIIQMEAVSINDQTVYQKQDTCVIAH